LYSLAIIIGLVTSRLTLLPLVDYLGNHSVEGEIKSGPWVTSLERGAADQNFIRRAIMAKIGIGNLTKDEYIFWSAFTDSNGVRLHSKNDYLVRFEKPIPVEKYGFWSLTVYNKENFLAKNPIGRYALGEKDRLPVAADGSLTILISSRQPADMSNWLPAPENDYFSLIIRGFMLKSDMLDDPAKVVLPRIISIKK
jgi:hypothetical protein